MKFAVSWICCVPLLTSFNLFGQVLNEDFKLVPSDGSLDDRFGSSTAVSDNTVLVGAYRDDDNGTSSGSAYVFVRDGAVWTQQAKLLPSDGAVPGPVSLEQFGNSVAIDRSTAVVSAERDGPGSAYVFGLASDSDHDGVIDDSDFCPARIIPESVPTEMLGINRWALTDADFTFDTLSPQGQGPNGAYNTTDTGGCSCEQIIVELGLGAAQTRRGCTQSNMNFWKAFVAGQGGP